MLNPNYILGFVDGEGSFHIAIYKDKSMKYGIKIIPEFHISQHKDNRDLLENFIKYFACGYIKYNHPNSEKDQTCVFVVRNRKDLFNKIIPFFQKHKLRTDKYKSFEIFAKIVSLMMENKHRDKAILKKILKMAYTMNRKGKYRRKKIIL